MYSLTCIFHSKIRIHILHNISEINITQENFQKNFNSSQFLILILVMLKVTSQISVKF